MTDRFMIDDCGTLIDMETRKSYDYVSEILPLLNQLNNENKIFENVKNKRDWDVINMEEPRKQSVSYRGVPCTARTCVTNLNRLTEENQQYKILVKELKKQNKKLKSRLNDLGVEYYD